MRIRQVSRSVLLGLTLIRVSSARAQASLAEWKLGATPQVTIGGDGSSRTEFLGIAGAWRLTGDEIAVVDRATREIRVFDARGAFRHSIGRKGEGPGEFQQVGWTGHFGDTAIIYDGNLRRITTILLRGTPKSIGEKKVNLEDDRDGGVAGRLQDGRWLIRGLVRPDVNARGAYRMNGFVGIAASSATGTVRWLTEMPDASLYVYTDPSDAKVGPAQVRPVSFGVPAFPAGMVVAAAGQTIWVGDGATDSLLRIDVTTGVKKTIRVTAGQPLTKDMVDQLRSRAMEGARTQQDRDAIEMRLGEKLLPKRLPAYESFIAGPRGEVWVMRGTPFRSMSAEYVVLGPNGVPIARVRTAPGFRVTDVGPGYVVGVHRDDDGVETVRVYALGT